MKKLFFIISFGLSTCCSLAQKLPAGPQVLTIFSSVDDTEQPYGLYLPKNYDENKKYPLVIMLHGAGSNHRLALRRVFGKSNAANENDVEATRYFPKWNDVDYIVATPFARGTAGYQGIAEKDVYDVLDDVKKRFSIDEDRTYLTGLSMGGGGTLWIGLTRPDIWAALAPVCPAPPKRTDDYISNALNIPMHFFHGDKDEAVPVTVSHDWVKRLKDLNTNVEYVEYPGVGHNSWENAYADGAIFSWFSKYKRNRFPDRVRFSSALYKYNKAYWVTLDKLTPGTLASIDAKFAAVNKLEITTTALDAFTLNLAGHSNYKSGEPIQLVLNGKKIKVPQGEKISFTLTGGKWQPTVYTPSQIDKKPGSEGPIREAFADRHIYVYGTTGNPTEDELKKRIAVATEAANWSVYRNAFLGRVMVFPRVVADNEVRPSDFESANLILFGTKETNSVIDKYKEQLPLHLKGESKEHGLLYIFPVNNHYVVVSAGLPWWTGLKYENSWRSLPFAVSGLPEFKDYILFKDSIKTVVAEGYFNNDWKLDDKAQKALRDAGVSSTSK